MKQYYLILSLALVYSTNLFSQTSFTATITPDLSVYGEAVSYPGEGEYQIFYSADNVLDKPVFLIDGFDPDDTRDLTGLYNSLNYSGGNLGDEIRADGFDIVLLNFPTYTRAADATVVNGGADFIERNAMLLVDLIGLINSQKVGMEQNVLIGPSMGGLISRYALNYMENQSLNHDTRLYISFDAPHHGANVPIGLQYQFNYLAFGLASNNVVELQPIVNGLLKSNAARQMLVDHLEAHLTGADETEIDPTKILPEAHPFRGIFNANINGLTTSGFPETVRNVSIINGSGIGSAYQDKLGNDISPGFTLINDTFTIDSLLEAALEINFAPLTSSGAQTVGKLTLFFLGNPNPIFEAQSQAFSYSNGIDAASGGLYNLASVTGSLDPDSLAGTAVAALTSDYFSFIPSVSAMAMEITDDEIDWYHDIDLGVPPGGSGRAVIDNTPFANWYMPNNNEEHVLLTPGNVQFALAEINQSTLSLSGLTLGTDMALKKNPISDELVILTNKTFSNTKVAIVDMTGKLVYSDNIRLNNNTSINTNLKSGLYILNVETPRDGTFKTKLLVN